MTAQESVRVVSNPLGIEVFDSLVAEREQAWLDQVFVEPDKFAAMTADSSIAVFGAPGSGKTTLRLMLARWVTKAMTPPPLIVFWRPTLLSSNIVGSDAALHLLRQASRLSALKLLELHGRSPTLLFSQRSWVQQIVIGFLKQSLGQQLDRELDKLVGRMGEAVGAPIRALVATIDESKSLSEPSLNGELIEALTYLRIGGIWLMIDELDAWLQADEAALTQSITALLASLVYLDESNVRMKWFLPKQIQGRVVSGGVLTRRRVEIFDLEWRTLLLQTIVERRLSAAFGDSSPMLRALLSTSGANQGAFFDHLKSVGGDLPRGWLEMARTYLRADDQGHINSPNQLDPTPIPPLRIDTTGSVLLGYREIAELQPMERKILQYLMVRYPEACSREELYYRVYLGLDHEPRSQEEDKWEPSTSWRGIIDNIVYRIRQSIEPNRRKPIYLITVPRVGIQLQNVSVRLL